jgi:hypothetical protein
MILSYSPDTDLNAAAAGVPDEVKAIVDEAAAIRGWAVQSFAQVEFALAYLVQKASEKWPDQYGPFGRTMPFKPERRPTRVRELLGVDGPLHVHAAEIGRIVEDLSSFEHFRHTIVHGWSDVLIAPNGVFLRFRLYKPYRGDRGRLP